MEDAGGRKARRKQNQEADEVSGAACLYFTVSGGGIGMLAPVR